MLSSISSAWAWFTALSWFGELLVGVVVIALGILLIGLFYAKVIVPALSFFSDF